MSSKRPIIGPFYDDDETYRLWQACRHTYPPRYEAEITNHLLYQSQNHLSTHQNKYEEPEVKVTASQFTLNRYGIDTFHGIMPDTGAAKVSSAGEAQFKALMREDPTAKFDESTAGNNKIQFGRGYPIASIGTVEVNTLFGPISFEVLTSQTTFLLSIADMDALGIYLDNTANQIKQVTTNIQHSAPIH